MTQLLKIGDKAPLLSLPSSLGGEVSLHSLVGQKVILYFYPKDNTPGCTIEAQEFGAQLAVFKKQNTVVLGISKDSIASHCRFSEKYQLKFHLLADEELKACNLYGVWREKSNYGKTYMGIVRSTFMIDEQGFIQYLKYGVSVKGHVEQILNLVTQGFSA